MPELMTSREAAEYLHIHVNTLHRLIHTGEIPAFRVGTRDYRIAREDIDAFLVSRRVK